LARGVLPVYSRPNRGAFFVYFYKASYGWGRGIWVDVFPSITFVCNLLAFVHCIPYVPLQFFGDAAVGNGKIVAGNEFADLIFVFLFV